MTKYLLFSAVPSPYSSAGWWRLLNIAKQIQFRGDEVVILSLITYSSFKKPIKSYHQGIPAYNIVPNIGINNPLVFIINCLLSYIVTTIFFLIYRPKIVIHSVPPSEQLIAVGFISKIFDCIYVVDYRDEFETTLIRDVSKYSWFYRPYQKWLTHFYTHSNLIVTVTPSVEQGLHDRGVENTYVLYDGVDTLVFKPYDKRLTRTKYDLSNDDFIIVFLGYVYDAYRLDVIIKSLVKLNDVKLLMIGGGDLNPLYKLASKFEVDDKIIYMGAIDTRTDLAKLVSSCDLGVIPYDDYIMWKKTLSTKLFEYAACGLPIIGTVHEASILYRFIHKYNIGLTCPPVDSDAFAKVVLKIMSQLKHTNIYKENLVKFAFQYDKAKMINSFLCKIRPED